MAKYKKYKLTLKMSDQTTISAGNIEIPLPEKGVDYFTDAEKAQMVNAVIAALPKYAGEVV